MFYYHVKNHDGDIVYSDLPEEYKDWSDKCFVKNETFVINSNKYRHGKITNDQGSVYLLTNEKEIVDRPRFFKEKLQVFVDFIPTIKNIEHRIKTKTTTHNRRLLHNLTTLNGHNIQEIFNLIPEEELRQMKEGRKKFIEDKIKGQIQKMPSVITNLMKNNAAIRMEFSVFGKLYGTKEKTKNQKHNIRRALMNVLHLFFQDFTDRDIIVEVNDCDREIYLDYEILQVALYQIFDNATKYALENTNITISFTLEEKSFDIIIDMLSIKIEEDEVSKITQDEFCGKYAKKINKNGKGIGMFVAKQVLALNHAKLDIIPRFDTRQAIFNGIEYESNRFIISFPKNLVV